MSAYRYAYRRLPVNADDGFPQAFRFAVDGRNYVVALSVTVVNEDLLHTGEPLSLPLPGAYLVMVVSREGPGPGAVLLRRKLVPRHEYEAAELAFVVEEMVVDRRNLNAAGSFGTRITAGVATRWAS
jgi:hypothetical protein